MTQDAAPPAVTDEEVRALLERYRCPVPFHAVRTRFLGGIAAPDLEAAPIKTVLALWGGELPVFESLDAANELISALVMGLWNQLTRHQERAVPFQLTSVDPVPTREGLGQYALRRQEELEGFAEGLFGSHEALDLPERANEALTTLGELRAMLVGLREVAEDPAKPAAPADIAISLGHLGELTRIAERELHEAVLSCTRARRHLMQAVPPTWSVH